LLWYSVAEMNPTISLGSVYKKRPHSGERRGGGSSTADNFQAREGGGSSDTDVRTLLWYSVTEMNPTILLGIVYNGRPHFSVQKIAFFKIHNVRTDKGERGG